MGVEWFGESKFVHDGTIRAPLPSHPESLVYQTKTFSVGELIKLLEKENPLAPVGTALSSVMGHVSGLNRLTHDEFGCVILDQNEEQLYSDEIGINSPTEEEEVKQKWMETARRRGCPQDQVEASFFEARRHGGKGTT